MKCKNDFLCVRFFFYSTVTLSSVGIAVSCGFVLLINYLVGICNNRYHAPGLYLNLNQILSFYSNYLCIM